MRRGHVRKTLFGYSEDPDATITVNGYEFTEKQLWKLIRQVFWKQTGDVDLNTPRGCQEAASVTIRFLREIGEDYHPGAEEETVTGSLPTAKRKKRRLPDKPALSARE